MDVPDIPTPEAEAAYAEWLATLDPAKCRPAEAPPRHICMCESSLCDHEGACPRPVDPRIEMQYVVHTCTQCAANMGATGGGEYLFLAEPVHGDDLPVPDNYQFAEELVVGDVIESHDDLLHTVERVELFRDGEDMVRITVERSDGGRYETDFPSDHRVALAS